MLPLKRKNPPFGVLAPTNLSSARGFVNASFGWRQRATNLNEMERNYGRLRSSNPLAARTTRFPSLSAVLPARIPCAFSRQNRTVPGLESKRKTVPSLRFLSRCTQRVHVPGAKSFFGENGTSEPGRKFDVLSLASSFARKGGRGVLFRKIIIAARKGRANSIWRCSYRFFAEFESAASTPFLLGFRPRRRTLSCSEYPSSVPMIRVPIPATTNEETFIKIIANRASVFRR